MYKLWGYGKFYQNMTIFSNETDYTEVPLSLYDFYKMLSNITQINWRLVNLTHSHKASQKFVFISYKRE